MKQFKFVEKKNLWLSISTLLILAGFISMGNRILNNESALNFGIDFIGGSTLHIKLNSNHIAPEKTESIKKIRSALRPLKLESSHIQFAENNEIYIKTVALEKNQTTQILTNLKDKLGTIEVLEVDFIGPSIGSALRKQSILIILFVSIALLGYISFRFELTFGIAAIIALTHDALIIFSMVSLLFIEINTAFIAALLTILGYSINDTIVIFDRIRENIEEHTHTSFATLTNSALNQTLVRTFNTSLTTLMVILSLIFFGGKTIQEFCIVLSIGILSGTYSSLCIASPLLNALQPKKES